MTKLKGLRLRKGLLQKDIAKVLNVTQAQYSRLELGISLMNADQIKILSVLFEVSTDDLLDMHNEDQFKLIHKEIADKLAGK